MKNKLSILDNACFKDSIVLVTGAGGTIGGEIVKRLRAKKIIAVDISEYAIYKLQRSIDNSTPKKLNVSCVVGDISDNKLVKMIFSKYKIDYVFNAAAYKHVDTLEDENNTYSVIKNNILSVINLCENAKDLRALIHISSDKAVYPTNNMGYTKLWCERIIQHYSQHLSTCMKIVRFGNVYASSGSFIETLQWQMDNNLPITITDDRMRRYFLSVSDAVTLINETVTLDNTNGTYILEMGNEVYIKEIVEDLNFKNLPITYIGIRAGEKFQETLVYDYEQLNTTMNPMINKINWQPVLMNENISKILNELKKDDVCLENLNQIIQTTTIL
jgi:FlaA1/EpsC-like NDP-sugar epimerase